MNRRIPCVSLCRITVVIGLILVTQFSHAVGGTIRHDRSDSLHTSLANEPRFDAVGKLTGSESGSGFLASGTLIDEQWVLTAGHVVDGTDGFGAGISNLRFQTADTTVTADQWFVHPNWHASGGESNLFAGWDMALVRLEQPVSDLSPAPLFTGNDELGQTATIVGFGATGTGFSGAQSNSAGNKRAGNNVVDIAGTETTPGSTVSIGNDRMLAIDFDQPGSPAASTLGSPVPLDLEYLVASGDSGGGLFLEVNGDMQLAGVTSLTSTLDGNVNSSYGDRGALTRVSPFVDWINDTIAANTVVSPPGLPGDFDDDNDVDGDDFLAWQRGLGSTFDASDLADWEANFGSNADAEGGALQIPRTSSIPEPTTFTLLLLNVVGVFSMRFFWSHRSADLRQLRQAPHFQQRAEELDIQVISDAEFFLLVGKQIKLEASSSQEKIQEVYSLTTEDLRTAERFANSTAAIALRAQIETWSWPEIQAALEDQQHR